MKAILARSMAALVSAFALLVMLAGIGTYVVNVAGAELAGSIRLIITAGGWAMVAIFSAGTLTGVGIGLFSTLSYAERWRKQRAERQAIEKANALTVITVPANHQVFVSDARHIAAPFDAKHLPRPDPFQVWAWQAWQELHARPSARIESKLPAQLPAGPEIRPDLLETIWRQPNILIVGAKNSGKTTLMQWLAYRRAKTDRILVFDSHDHPAKWPVGEVVGNGRDYQTIWKGMLGLVNLLDKRYKAFAAGRKRTGEFGTITNMIDEFTLLPGTLKDKVGGDVQTYSTPMLTEGRKVDLEIIWGSHSDRAEALGLKGKYDLLECFDVIVYLKHVNGERYAYINFGEGLDKGTRYQLPGPFVLPGQPAGELSVERRTSELVEPDDQSPLSFTVVSDAESGEVEPDRPSPADEVVMVAFFTVKDECAADGRHFAWSQVCDKLGISPGGKQYGRIKAILDRWGIDYQDL